MVRGSLALLVALAFAPAPTALGDAEPRSDAQLQAIEDGFGSRTRAETIRLLESWLDAHPHDPDLARAATWAGHLHRQVEEASAARRAYERAIATGGVWSFRAYAALGDLELDERRYTAAIAAYEGASSSPEAYWAGYGRAARVRAEGARRQAFTATGLAAALTLQTVLFALAAWRRRGRAAFWPLPWEIKFYLPFAVVMSLAASSIQPAKRGAIRTVCWAGLAVVAGFAAYSRASTPTRAKRIVGALLVAASAAALVYASLFAFGLVDTLGHWDDAD
jgi:tetratricopeptide (TPR) repeat protein